MSEVPPTTDIQFDQAEFKGDPVALACSSCGQGISAAYYQVGEAITCEACRWRIESEGAGGSAAGRFVKAALLGGIAAAIGAGVYYAIRALTGYEFGLIAVVVGLFVGGAVRMGSAHRGGVPYQILAMFLTYASIVSTYVPDIVKALRDQPVAAEGASGAPAGEAPEATAAPAAAASDAEPATGTPAPLGALFLVLAVGAVMAIAFAAPFLMGFENIIGIVIIAIGLFEAWKMNRKPDRTVTGPFRIEGAR